MDCFLLLFFFLEFFGCHFEALVFSDDGVLVDQFQYFLFIEVVVLLIQGRFCLDGFLYKTIKHIQVKFIALLPLNLLL